MISSKQQPQRSAAAIASLRAVLTRPGFNGAITCTTRNVSSIQVICNLVPFEIFPPSWRVHRGRGRGGCSRWRWRCRGRAPSWERKLYLGSHRTSAVFGIRANRWFNIKLIQFNIKLIQFHPLPLQLKILGVRSDKNTVGWMVTNPPQTMTRFRQQNIC